jgi:4-amino-4-deoxy-L-arabinose transferase-like glycosyltransferase
MKAALAIAFAVIIAAVVAQLAHETTRLAGSNNVRPDEFVVTTKDRARLCQRHEALFEQTAFVRMTIGTYGRPGPPLTVSWQKEGHELTRAELPAGWRDGVVRIPLAHPPPASVGDVTVCFQTTEPARLAWAGESVDRPQGATVDAKRRPGKLSMVSELSDKRSLFDMLSSAASRYQAGNTSWFGEWTFWGLIAVLLGALAAAGAALVRRNEQTDRRVPPSAFLCAVTALLVCSVWAILTPPFHVPDEISHMAYVQAVAESGELPLKHDGPTYSQQERNLLASLDFGSVIGRPASRPPWTAFEEAEVRSAENAPASREVSNATTASANPPLYYLIEAPVYWATPSASLLDKLVAMRLVSALFGALTVLAIFLFLRELVPGSPWLWSVGALVCTFHPGFGFVSSGVNPDALVFTLSAATFWLMARLFRRGATFKRVAALGAVVAAGVLTKPLFIGLVPAAALAVLAAVVRSRRPGMSPRTALAMVATAAAVAGLPVLAYHGISRAAFDHPYFAKGTSTASTVGTSPSSYTDEASYIWQLFLPRVPGLQDQFPGFALRDIWLSGFTGQFGWLDYRFPPWVLDWTTWLGLALLIGAVTSLFIYRRRMRGRWLEFGAYVVAAAGIAFAIGSQDYSAGDDPGRVRFIQARYLMPLLALYAGLVAVAIRPARARVGAYVAVAVVTLAAIHDVAAMLLTVGRYYV